MMPQPVFAKPGSIPKMTMRPLPLFERLFYYNMSRHGSTLKTRAVSVQGEEAEPTGGRRGRPFGTLSGFRHTPE